jgi:hypothetical protein
VLALKSKKVIVKVSFKKISEPGLEPELQYGFDFRRIFLSVYYLPSSKKNAYCVVEEDA